MSTCILSTGTPKRMGFIGTRFEGTDGVSLETRKATCRLNPSPCQPEKISD